MFIVLGAGGAVRLEEADDFTRFHVEADDPRMTAETAAATLGAGSEATGADELWITTDRVRALSGRDGDADWNARFRKMLEAVQRFGWSDPELRRMKAHLKRAG